MNRLFKKAEEYIKTILPGFLNLFGMSLVDRHIQNIQIALQAIKTNKLKSVLTGLGIIFGVAAVISMMAIGNGAKHEILEQLKYVGVNNIFIEPTETVSNEGENEKSSEIKKSSKGLSVNDVQSIAEVVPTIKYISPEVSFNTSLTYGRIKQPVKLLGIDNEYFLIYDFKIVDGSVFNHLQDKYSLPVCIISSTLKSKLFKNANPINKYIKCGRVWLKVIGVYEKKAGNATKLEGLNINFSDDNIYTPIKTMLIRYVNKPLLALNYNQMMFMPPEANKKTDHHQLSRIVLQVQQDDQIENTSKLLDKMILRRHSGIRDFKVLVPEMLIKQHQRAKNIFNFVLGAIAGISLLVGGIGIMNIMYASVLARMKEIGVRRAMGATRKDVMVQFISESILISISGGLIGVLLGIIISQLITQIAGISTIISIVSILTAFIVSICIGIIFGFSPARNAAFKNPIELLRYE